MAHHAWTRLRAGGEVQEVTDPLGRPRRVVANRKIIPVGEQVSKSKLSVSDEEWQELLDSGSVREYPYPDMPQGSTESPVDFLRRTLRERQTSEEEKLVAAVQAMQSGEKELVEEADKK